MNRTILSVIGVTAIAVTLLFIFTLGNLRQSTTDNDSPGKSGRAVASASRLKMFAGAGLRKAVEALEAEFEKQSGIELDVDYAGSGIAISRAREDKTADLFMPGDVWYVDRLQELTGNVIEKTPVSYFIPVIIVQKGNPKNIRGLSDFLRKDVTAAMGNPDACQIGRLMKKIFKKNGLDYEQIDPKLSLTVNELGVWVKMKNVDMSVVWDAIAENIKDSTDKIMIPPTENIISRVVVGRLKTSKHPEAARKFVRFLQSPEARAILRKKGYTVDLPDEYKKG